MEIIKKSGKKEAFSPEKIKRSLLAAAQEANISMTENELDKLLSEVQQFTKDKNLMTTNQINVIISGLLYTRGYLPLLKHYANFVHKKIV